MRESRDSGKTIKLSGWSGSIEVPLKQWRVDCGNCGKSGWWPSGDMRCYCTDVYCHVDDPNNMGMVNEHGGTPINPTYYCEGCEP